MPISKLAGFMEIDPSTLTEFLLLFKHKMHNVVWTKGISSLEGDFQADSEVSKFFCMTGFFEKSFVFMKPNKNGLILLRWISILTRIWCTLQTPKWVNDMVIILSAIFTSWKNCIEFSRDSSFKKMYTFFGYYLCFAVILLDF